MRSTLRRIHRWLAIGCALLWLSQAATGLLMVYRWELDDVALRAVAAPLDVAALGARIEELGQRTSDPLKVDSLWATGGVDGRFDLFARDAAGQQRVLRVDGAGRLLRERPDGDGFLRDGLIPVAADLHQTLLAGDTGHVVVGVSGLILLSAIAMGTVLGWPRRRQLRATLLPRGARPGAARRYAWHRAAGLWLALPAFALVAVGVMLVFYDPIERWMGEDALSPQLQSLPAFTGTPVAPAVAIATAMQRFPAATLSGVSFPGPGQAWYQVRLRQPVEWRRVYGTTTVYVAATTGDVLYVQDPLHASSMGRRFLDNLYPVHTGEAAGTVGRLLSLAVGAWLLSMLVLGLGLWWSRGRKLT